MALNLEKIYDYSNKKFYGNKLPEIEIKYSKRMHMKHAMGETLFVGLEPKRINIAYYLQYVPSQCIITVLHEMAHVKLGRKVGHGKKFKAELLRLHKVGAYDGLL
jgi:predicted metal-dependent hydrolase